MSDKDVPYSKQWETEIAEYQDAKKALLMAELGLRQKFAPILVQAERDLDLKAIQDVIKGLPNDCNLVSVAREVAVRVQCEMSLNKN